VVTAELQPVRGLLVDRVKLTVAGGLSFGLLGIAVSDAGGPSAGLLGMALLGLALWLGRTPTAPGATARGGAMTGNQALLLVLALGGAAVLIAAGAASRPLHGLAVAPFAMAAFALSSHNSRDLRSGVLAAVASLLVLSSADDRALVLTLCAAGLVPLVFAWAAVRQLMLLDRYPDLAVTVSRPSGPPWSVSMVARLVVLTAVVALLMPTEPAPHLHGGDGSGGGDSSSTQPAGSRGSVIAGADGGLDLRERGGLDANPVIDVPADSPTHWQGGFVDAYNGSTWTRTNAVDAGPTPSALLPGHYAMKSGSGYTIAEVHRLAPGQDLVYSPGPLMVVDAPSGRLYDLGTGSIEVYDRHDPTAPYTIDYRVSGTTSTGSLTAAAVGVGDPRWLQLPAELPSRVRDLARTVTAAATTTQGKVAAIETYLRANEKYTLDSPVPAEGTDAVDAFLFRDHVGFCEQFASAEAVMLRAIGVPARVATGYGGQGVPTADGRRVYRNEDAHAWVQVGYPGERWVDSDPTAGTQLAPATARHRLSAWLKKLWKQLTGTALARRLLAVGLLALAVLLGLLLRLVASARRTRRARRDERGSAASPALETPAGKAYQRLLGRLDLQGRPRRPTETVRDLLFRLSAPDRDVVVQVLEGEWYGRQAAFAPQVVERVVGVLDQLAVEQTVAPGP
jgi:protein-glutamine gamma-glutamyltransferase